MSDLSGMEAVNIPDGWQKEALFWRLVTKGICSYQVLASPNTSLRSVFGMLRMLDFEDYLELKSRKKA